MQAFMMHLLYMMRVKLEQGTIMQPGNSKTDKLSIIGQDQLSLVTMYGMCYFDKLGLMVAEHTVSVTNYKNITFTL